MKLGNYVIMLLVMLVFLEFTGIPTSLSATLNTFGIHINSATSELIAADLGGASFWAQAIAVLTSVSLVGAVVIGLFAKSYDTSLVILPLVVFVSTSLIGSFWGIMLLVQGSPDIGGWAIKLIATLFIAMGLGFVWSCVDYFAGR